MDAYEEVGTVLLIPYLSLMSLLPLVFLFKAVIDLDFCFSLLMNTSYVSVFMHLEGS
jgi:hypothetical protein